MSQQSGRALLIKIEGNTPGQYVALCGFKARNFPIANNIVDRTVPDCVAPTGKVVEKSTYGIQSIRFSGSGIFDNDAVGKQVANAAFNQTALNCQVIVPGWGDVVGSWLVENFDFSGAEEGNMDFESAFRLDGTGAFTAE